MKKILFLGYNKSKTCLIDFIKDSNKNYNVYTSNKILQKNEVNQFDNIICFGYKKIINKDILKTYKNKIINLHVSFLPYNRGSHPNFWSFVENTPAGVTIHEVDEGVDTGKIINQKQIVFDLNQEKNKLTFRSTYKILIREIEMLFKSDFRYLIENEFNSTDQIGKGTYHYKYQLPTLLKSWDQKVYNTVLKYNKLNQTNISKKLKIIDEIENTRKNNNINWMNIVRNGLKFAPDETLEILKKINFDDNKISKLFKKLSD